MSDTNPDDGLAWLVLVEEEKHVEAEHWLVDGNDPRGAEIVPDQALAATGARHGSPSLLAKELLWQP
jgi:hypothetical protein